MLRRKQQESCDIDKKSKSKDFNIKPYILNFETIIKQQNIRVNNELSNTKKSIEQITAYNYILYLIFCKQEQNKIINILIVLLSFTFYKFKVDCFSFYENLEFS